MKEIDDKSLELFFKEHRQEMEDNGFTRRVISRLPERSWKLSRIWVVFCSVIGISLFWYLDGLALLKEFLLDIFVDVAYGNGLAFLDPKSVVIVVLVLITLGMKRLCSLD
ncbi:MAG: DUF5056 domain-containing protein [Bacteroides sp.]|nr:DUF5056 domain-containing protein [Bacteroides sp.]